MSETKKTVGEKERERRRKVESTKNLDGKIWKYTYLH